jgi:hypothetical protein
MSHYLIELAHGDEGDACIRALRAIEQSGSHFVTHAYWGCVDGTHCGWMIVELDNRNDALQIIPPEFRQEARIVQLNQFTREKIASMAAGLED